MPPPLPGAAARETVSAGEAALARMIAGFIEPSGGAIYVHGPGIEHAPPFARSIGLVFQRLAIFPQMTAAPNIAYPLRMRGFPRHPIPDRVDHSLKLVQLRGLGGLEVFLKSR